MRREETEVSGLPRPRPAGYGAKAVEGNGGAGDDLGGLHITKQ